MPHYQFFCRSCKKSFTAVMSLEEYDKAKGKAKCPKCGKSTNVEQQVAAFYAVTSKKS
jgi:putative FmdB family regulatory protein